MLLLLLDELFLNFSFTTPLMGKLFLYSVFEFWGFLAFFDCTSYILELKCSVLLVWWRVNLYSILRPCRYTRAGLCGWKQNSVLSHTKQGDIIFLNHGKVQISLISERGSFGSRFTRLLRICDWLTYLFKKIFFF